MDKYQGKVQVDTGTVLPAGAGMVVAHMVAVGKIAHMVAVDRMEGIQRVGVGMVAAEVVDILQWYMVHG